MIRGEDDEFNAEPKDDEDCENLDVCLSGGASSNVDDKDFDEQNYNDNSDENNENSSDGNDENNSENEEDTSDEETDEEEESSSEGQDNKTN